MKLRPTDKRPRNRWAAGTRWHRQRRMSLMRTHLFLLGRAPSDPRPTEPKSLN